MCGLFGWTMGENALTQDQKVILATSLSLYNDSRGSHSWGVYGSGKIVKGLGKISAHILELASHSHIFAHTRYATHGGVNLDNAHPFQFGSVIGSHNGVIYNHDELNIKYGRDFDVDSMHIFANLENNKPLDDLEGYGAITWSDGHGEFYLCKMHNGELSAASFETEGGKGVVWSSDVDHLRESLDLLGIKYQLYRLEENQVYFTDKNEIFTLTGCTLSLQKSMVKRKKWNEYGSDIASALDTDLSDTDLPDLDEDTLEFCANCMDYPANICDECLDVCVNCCTNTKHSDLYGKFYQQYVHGGVQ